MLRFVGKTMNEECNANIYTKPATTTNFIKVSSDEILKYSPLKVTFIGSKMPFSWTEIKVILWPISPGSIGIWARISIDERHV